jgi:hypothetical protein
MWGVHVHVSICGGCMCGPFQTPQLRPLWICRGYTWRDQTTPFSLAVAPVVKRVIDFSDIVDNPRVAGRKEQWWEDCRSN